MQIRDLGPLVVERDGLPVGLGAGRLAAALSPLANRVGEVVGTTALVEAVWGPHAPPRAPQLLESVIWRLRKELEPGRAARAAPVLLRRETLGYRLDLPPDAVDSTELRTAAPQIRGWAADGRSEQVLERSAGVLSRWRGEPYADLTDHGWLGPARQQLVDARIDIAELRVQALLDLGRPEDAIGELDPLLAEHPLRERLWAQRIAGLYRAGRPADALADFTRARAVLADELGIDPGRELRELHRRILEQDPALDLRPATRPTVVVSDLPRGRTSLIGRDDDLATLTGELGQVRLVTLAGPGGAGKTRLAVEVGHAAARFPDTRFPDGVHFVDLAPVRDRDLLVVAIAGTLEPAGQPGRRPIEVVTARLADADALLILDNCEQLIDACAEVVPEILDRCPRVRVLATSREPLELPGEYVHRLGPLPVAPAGAVPGPAQELFLARTGGTTGPDPADPDGELVRRICLAVGGLPLGIELAAAQADTFALSEIVEALEHNPAELARRGTGPPRQASLRETVDWGYRLARHDEQVLHRRLAVIPGPFTLDVATALCDLAPLRADRAMSLVGGLVHRSLLVAARPTRGASSFHQLAPIRAHAASVLDDAERAAIEAVRDRWLNGRIAAAPVDGAGQAAFLDWLEGNAATLRASLDSTLHRGGDRTAPSMVLALLGGWFERGRLTEAAHWVERLRARPRGRHPLDDALVDVAAGAVLALEHHRDPAAELLRSALPRLESAPADSTAQVASALRIGAVAAWTGDLWDIAADYQDAGLRFGHVAGLPHLELACRAIRAANWSFAGDRAAGIAEAGEVLQTAKTTGNDLAALFALVALTVTALTQGEPQVALGYSDQLLLTHRRMGTLAVSDTIETRASIRLGAGDLPAAVRCLGASAGLNRRLGRDWPWHEFTPAVLDELRQRLDPAEFDRHWASGERLGRGDPERFTPDWI